MNIAKVLNALNAPAFLLILIGLGSFLLAGISHQNDVRTALLGAATGLISAGLLSFQHASRETSPESSVAAASTVSTEKK